MNLGFVTHNLHDYRESFLPFLITLMPRMLANKYGDTLKHNEQALISSWDL